MDTLLNLLIGIWGGLVSGVIVSKVFMLIQDYYSKYGDIKKYILILYRIQIYLKVVSSRFSKTITYENNQNCPIGKEDKDVFRIEKLVDDIYPEILYSKYKEKELESTRNSIKEIAHGLNIKYAYECSVEELQEISEKIEKILSSFSKIENSRMIFVIGHCLKDRFIMPLFIVLLIVTVSFIIIV